jgi:hypothetical protein
MAMTSTQLETCSGYCAANLREDRRQGLIYGPYRVDGKFVGSLRFAGHADMCTYCNNPLPRGRAKRILTRLGEVKA